MNPFAFSEVRLFLRNYIQGLPSHGRGEVSRLASYLQVSPTLVSQVLAGDKYFTLEQIQKLNTYLGCTALESEFLIYLTQKERAGSEDLRKFWDSKLKEILEKSRKLVHHAKPRKNLSENDRVIFYSNSIYAAVSLFTSIGEEGKSLEEVCARFELTRERGMEILQFLSDCAICIEKKGRFFPGTQDTHVEQESPHTYRHHLNWRLSSMQKCSELQKSELMYSAPVSISKKDFSEFRDELAILIQRFLKRVHASPAEEIACFNIDWFIVD